MTIKATKIAWSPYLAGGLTGLLNVMIFFISDNSIGTSAAFSRFAGYLEKTFASRQFETLAYFREKVSIRPDWQIFFLSGILLGSLAAALLWRDFRWESIPSEWKRRFGASRGKRWLFAFLGGTLAMFGARMAGGCTSGHGLSGSIQLALSGFVTVAMMFAGGVAATRLIFRKK